MRFLSAWFCMDRNRLKPTERSTCFLPKRFLSFMSYGVLISIAFQHWRSELEQIETVLCLCACHICTHTFTHHTTHHKHTHAHTHAHTHSFVHSHTHLNMLRNCFDKVYTYVLIIISSQWFNDITCSFNIHICSSVLTLLFSVYLSACCSFT